MHTVEYNNCIIMRKTKGRVPSLPFLEIKEDILGKKYDLSVVFPTIKESISLHLQWKKEPGPVNILSFPLDEESGEIIMTLTQARKEAPKYNRNYHNHLVFLFIHGCLHLKGMTHGAKMEQQEQLWYKKFATQ